MFASLRYVIKENFNNLYRIYTISKYELVADVRDSRLGLFWNFAHPLIQVMTYWFAFGIIFERKAVTAYGVTVPYIYWMMGGMVVWFFISPCITHGCSAIYSKAGIIKKMKFPVSILPATVVMKELFNHLCLLLILVCVLLVGGYYPSLYWLELIYYLFCGVVFAVCLSMTTSVLTMLARDVKKMVQAFMRLLLYMTPILWTASSLDRLPGAVQVIIKLNPIYYLVQGYRDCFFYHRGILAYWQPMLAFWGVTLVLLLVGSYMMYKFKYRLIDLI